MIINNKKEAIKAAITTSIINSDICYVIPLKDDTYAVIDDTSGQVLNGKQINCKQYEFYKGKLVRFWNMLGGGNYKHILVYDWQSRSSNGKPCYTKERIWTNKKP